MFHHSCPDLPVANLLPAICAWKSCLGLSQHQSSASMSQLLMLQRNTCLWEGGPKSKAGLVTLLTLPCCLNTPTRAPWIGLVPFTALLSGRIMLCKGEHTTIHPHPMSFTPPKHAGQAQNPSLSQVRATDTEVRGEALGPTLRSTFHQEPLWSHVAFLPSHSR